MASTSKNLIRFWWWHLLDQLHLPCIRKYFLDVFGFMPTRMWIGLRVGIYQQMFCIPNPKLAARLMAEVSFAHTTLLIAMHDLPMDQSLQYFQDSKDRVIALSWNIVEHDVIQYFNNGMLMELINCLIANYFFAFYVLLHSIHCLFELDMNLDFLLVPLAAFSGSHPWSLWFCLRPQNAW